MKTDQQIKAEEKDAEERIFTATEVVEFIILGLLLIAAAAQTIANLTGP